MLVTFILAASVVLEPLSSGDVDVDALVETICNESLDRVGVRLPAAERLAAADAELSAANVKRLVGLLPGTFNTFTIALVKLLGEKGDEQALDALIKHSTKQRIGRLVTSYAIAIEALESRLEVRRKLHPFFRRYVDEIREKKRKESGRENGDSVGSLIAIIRGDLGMEERTAAAQALRQKEEGLTDQQIHTLVAVLPGEQDAFTAELVLLLGQKGNEEALDALVTHSTKQRVFQLMVNYAVAIEMLETRLEVTRQLDPAVRTRIDKIRQERVK